MSDKHIRADGMDANGMTVQPHDITDHLFGWVENNYALFPKYLGLFFALMAVVGNIFGVFYIWFPFLFLAAGSAIGYYVSIRRLRKPLLLIGFAFILIYAVSMSLPESGVSSPAIRLVLVVVGAVLYIGLIAFGMLVAKDYYVVWRNPLHRP